MSDWRHDPRERDIDDADWCVTHQQRGSSCGKCYREAMDDAEHAWWLDSQPDSEDETKGAALAARFGG